ncbi:DEAD/DEAH box helicase family protein [Candidatus Woesearchaeota archaeon]|nr:DEAD/DEAH box helicase family protein [Nanoarchaeota archaeon]MCB9370087.1 DEAD/DEAH box helicase family protein [Candidatus Woesearchaeota archaeon]USN44618.1 MAG: DEAD/DEAH box helicase family protein [Candidatus Woesearchaeota archaeon]
MKKRQLSETDIKTKYITPALKNAGWDIKKFVREEVSFTAGKVIINGKTTKRGERKRADYLLFAKDNLPLAVIEAKDNNHSVSSGLMQGVEYGEILDIPFVYSSNGDAFVEFDRTKKAGTIQRELRLEQFPSPEELWQRYKESKNIVEQEIEKLVTQDYYVDSNSQKEPRYYQRIAINRTIEAVAKGQKRILLVMATGTGKTYTAFQIIWRLWKGGVKKRILFLADRNILVDQTRTNDFKPFGDKMTKVEKRKIDTAYEIYLALYQGLTGEEEWKNIYKQFSRDFFDLIVIDECHRGSAAEDSAWREVLDYFSNATHIGMTATPKETKDVSNIQYFGEALYTYSLKQGIEDGFLAPYKVVRITFDKDIEWRPYASQTDKYGEIIPDKEYSGRDYDKEIVLEKRTELVAKKISSYLKQTDRFDKTIVFCNDIEHAQRMTLALMNENSDLVAKNRKYVMQITGDNNEGKKELDNFIDPESSYPVIATSSKLMTTGVDAQTCKLIVLDSNIQSMTEFKQIIGRGTRINEDFGKYSFTILDFRGVTRLFADPDFDGEPIKVCENSEDSAFEKVEEILDVYGEEKKEGAAFIKRKEKMRKYYVHSVPVEVSSERVQYFGSDGKLITESLRDYTKKNIRKEYRDLDDFLKKWQSVKKAAIIKELEQQGIFFHELEREVGKELDPFDLVCHIAYDQKALTRKERASNVKKRNYFGKYGEKARKVIEVLLDKYADTGIENIESLDILKVKPLSDIGSPLEIVKLFGGKKAYLQVINELEKHLYSEV